jgi:hypothetical protein
MAALKITQQLPPHSFQGDCQGRRFGRCRERVERDAAAISTINGDGILADASEVHRFWLAFESVNFAVDRDRQQKD